jgi:hypothetical protein
MVARKKKSAKARPKAKKRRIVRKKSPAGVRRKAAKPRAVRKKKSARVGRLAAAAQNPVVEQLKAQIAAGKIIFDAARLKNQLLGLNAGTRVTRKLQFLVLQLSKLASPNIAGALGGASRFRTSGRHWQ